MESSVTNAEDQRALENCRYLLGGIAWRDSLLQSYRILLVTTHSILLLVATVMFAVSLQTESLLIAKVLIYQLVGLVMIAVAVLSMQHLNIVIRGRDVTWWQRRLLDAEKGLRPDERHFTKFREHQAQQRALRDKQRHRRSVKETRKLEEGPGRPRTTFNLYLFLVPLLAWFAVGSVTMVQYFRVVWPII
jgi:hypothetical protein